MSSYKLKYLFTVYQILYIYSKLNVSDALDKKNNEHMCITVFNHAKTLLRAMKFGLRILSSEHKGSKYTPDKDLQSKFRLVKNNLTRKNNLLETPERQHYHCMQKQLETVKR